MFMEFHILQSFPPANLNRDDTNNPKDALFGGVRRARISSQSFKRAIRTTPVFAETTKVAPAQRTRYLKRLLLPKLKEAGKDEEEAGKVLDKVIPALFSKLDRKHPERTAVLIYIGQKELDDLAEQILQRWETLAGEEKAAEKEAKELSKSFVKQHKNIAGAPDIALFGRMLAEKPDLNIEAATQVAHALSTHRISMEMDFYTAVDDLSQDDETGAGMMGYTGYDSATFYRYLRLDWGQLVKNLGGDLEMARRTVEGFIRAMIEAVPSGKQNAFAAYTPPGLVLGVVREGSFAWSLVNAFEKPVRPKGGYMRPSVEALDGYWGRITAVYGEDSVKAKAVLALEEDLPLQHLKADLVPDLATFLKRMLEALPGGEA